MKPEYNDLPLVYDTKIYEELISKGDTLLIEFQKLSTYFNHDLLIGIDHLLARHLAHLFIRDPLVVYRETLDQDDTKSLDHFEVRLDFTKAFLVSFTMIISFSKRIFNPPIGKQ